MSANSKNFIIFSILLGSIFGYFSGGFYSRASTFFNLNYLATLFLGTYFMWKMEARPLFHLSISSLVVGAAVEYTNISAGSWSYYGGGKPPIFAVFGWILMMVIILGLARFAERVFPAKEKSALSVLPVLTCIVLMPILMLLEGYLSYAGWKIILLYSAMGIAGLHYSRLHSLKWNLFLMLGGMVVGGYTEAIGALSNLWWYRFSEILPAYLIFGWAFNTWAVHAFSALFGTDFEVG